MTIKELETKLAELKAQGKITDETHILSYNDDLDVLYESEEIMFITDDEYFAKESIEADIDHYKKCLTERGSLFNYRMLSSKNKLLDKLNNEWKDAIRIG